MSNPLLFSAMAVPMRPAPMIPRVFLVTSLPNMSNGSHPLKCPFLVNVSASRMRLVTENMSAQASSAVVSVSTSGVLQIGIFSFVAVVMSILS